MSETAVNILPTVDYPPMIRGSLRLILQLKDAFLGCFNLIEEYRSQLLTCQRSFARDIVVCQLTQGLEGIKRLREDLEDVKSQAQARIERNSALREYLTKNFSVVVLSEPSKNQGTGQSNEGIMSNSGGSSTNVTVVDRILPPPISAPDAVSAALHGGLDQFTFKDINVDCLQVPEEIDLATCTTEGGSPLLPVVEFYRGFYFLQMHFQIIMCQAANYAMPVVTRTMSLAERTFAWPSIPGFGLKAKNGTMRDRLLEIHTDVIQLAQRLHACMELVNDKIAQDKRIEQYYLQHSSAQEEVRRNLLRSLQAQRVYTECLEGQNDRLAGLATKLNPKFVKTADFAEMTGPIITIKEPRRRDINQNSSEVVLVNSSNVDSCNTSQHDVLLMDSNCDVKINESNEFVQKLNTGRSYINADKYFKVNNSQTTPSRETINSQKRHTNTNKTSDMPKSLESIQNSGSIAVDNLLLGIDSVASGNLKRHEQLQQQKHMNKSNAVKVNESISPNETSPSKNHQVQINSHLNPLIKTPSTQFSQVECLSTQSSVDGHPVSVTSRHLGDDNNNTPRLSESRSMTRPTQNTSITLNQPVDYSSTSESKAKDDQLNGWRQQNEHIRLRCKEVDIRHQRSGNNDDEEYEFTDETFSSKGRNLRLNTSPNYSLDPSSSQENSDLSRNLNTNVNASDIHLPRILPKVKRFGRKDQHLRSSRSASTSAIKYLDHNSFESDEIQRKPGQGRLHNNRMDNNIHPCKKCHEYQLQYDRIKCNDGSQRVLNHKSHYTVNEMSQINNGVKLVPTVGTDECSKICIPEWSAKLVHKSNKAEDLLQDPKRSAINRALISHRCRLVETILQADEEKLEEIISLLLKD